MVAQVNPACPAAAWRRASAVHLCALTCGRSRAPGRAAAMVAMLADSTAASAISAGVGMSLRRRAMPGTLPAAAGQAPGRAGQASR
jgi:hypothetical protein